MVRSGFVQSDYRKENYYNGISISTITTITITIVSSIFTNAPFPTAGDNHIYPMVPNGYP